MCIRPGMPDVRREDAKKVGRLCVLFHGLSLHRCRVELTLDFTIVLARREPAAAGKAPTRAKRGNHNFDIVAFPRRARPLSVMSEDEALERPKLCQLKLEDINLVTLKWIFEGIRLPEPEATGGIVLSVQLSIDLFIA